MYRPKPHILISINSDGSGSVKQYNSYQDAKVAYNALSGSTISAFIYAKPNKSLAGGTSIDAVFAIPAKVEFTKVQNATAVYNIAHPSYAGLHPEIAQFSPSGGGGSPITTPPLPRVIERNPFTPDDFNAWQTFCTNNPTHPECTNAGNPQFGTLISSACETAENYKDTNGVNWPVVSSVKKYVYANGVGGEYEEYPHEINSSAGGCFWPQGYATRTRDTQLYFDNATTPKALINVSIKTYSANGDFMARIDDTLFGDSWTTSGIQDGQGNERDIVEVGLTAIGGNFESALVDYGYGDLLRNPNNPSSPHSGSIQGWAVTTPSSANSPSPEICYGRWLVDFMEYTNSVPPNTIAGQSSGSYPRGVRLRFRYKPDATTISPFETVPPTNSVGRKLVNEFNDEFEGINSNETIEPQISYEQEYQTVFVEEVGYDANVAFKQKAHMTAALDGPYHSEWSEMTYFEAGTELASDSTNFYRATGDGSYWVDPRPTNECSPAGTPMGSTDRDIELIIYEDNAPSAIVGTQNFPLEADGNCGTSETPGDITYLPHGTYLTNGDTLKFYSDGVGSYFTTPINEFPSAGTVIGTENSNKMGGPDNQFVVGFDIWEQVADGMGSYSLGMSAINFEYKPDGTYLGEAYASYYYSDGNGGYYTGPMPCDDPNLHSGEAGWSYDGCLWTYEPCEDPSAHLDEAGWTYDGCNWSYQEPVTIVGYEGEENYITIPSGQNVVNATRVRPQYSDATVGDWTEWNYTAAGTLYGSDAYNHYFADGAGGYYAEYTPPLPSGTYLGTSEIFPIAVNVGCGDWLTGSYTYDIFADGSGGTYADNAISTYTSSGTYLGDCDGYRYTSNGWGGYYSEASCESDTLHSGESGWSYDGCYWSYSEPCPSSGTDLGVDPNNSCDNLYADGSCGTYSSGNGSCQTCDYSGYHYSNNGPYDLMYDAGCGGVQIGYYYENVYADGMCGTYTTNEYTYNPGDFATCNGYIHSVDSAGNISQRPETTCPDAGQYEYTDGDYTYYTDGNCGTYSVFTGTCSSYGLSTGAFGTDSIFAEVYECFSIEVGTTSWEDFHDGTCGTYRSYQSPTYFYSYGSYLGNCNGYDYYSDGGSGYYY